jgi:hypothetical protein
VADAALEVRLIEDPRGRGELFVAS